MDVIPAIDLLDGGAVRLLKGRYDAVTRYAHDPVELARTWRTLTARLHLVDLEGARSGRAVQRDLVRRVAEAFGSGVQAGGGIRTLEAASDYLELGVERVVLGTAVIRDPELVRAIARAYPGRVVVALDARAGRVATDGWEHVSDRLAVDVVSELDDVELAGVLYTDIERDGTEVGPNVTETSRLASRTRFGVIASGGVGTLEHLAALARAPGPIAAAIVGRALHEQRFSLEEAVSAASGG